MKTINEIIDDLKTISNNLEKEKDCSPDKCKLCDKCVICDIDNVIDDLISVKAHIKEIL